MKRSIGCNREAVSTVLAYLFSFSIASMVMVSSVIITTNIIDDKTASVAGIAAQSLANKVADALVEAAESKQSMPEAFYQKTLDIPIELAGKSYYIETTSTRVYVNTTDGAVSESSTTYGAENLSIGISGKVYSGSSELDLISNKSDFVYKLDFGTGNSTDHSPVEPGYYMVSDRSTISQFLLEPPWWDLNYHYRIPIKVKNDASEDLDEVPVKIVLDTTNFDYSNANVSVTSSSTVSSDLVFIDSERGHGIAAEIEISPDTWYTWWLKDYLVGDIEIEVTIIELSEGHRLDNIDGNSIKLNGVSCVRWDGAAYKATFDPQEVLLSLLGFTDGGEVPPGDNAPAPGEYTITISGSLYDWTPFYGHGVVTVALANILVDDNAIPGWYDATHVQTIQEGVDSASTGDTVFVYDGDYDGGNTIDIDKTLNLIGESRNGVVIRLVAGIGDVVDVTADNVYIDSVTIRDGFNWNVNYDGNGIRLDACHDVSIINCNIHANEENGILVQNSWDNKIINCSVYDNGNGPDDPLGSPSGVPDAGIYLYGGGSKRNIIKDCNVFDNDEIGIWLDVAWDNNIVENCNVYNTVGSTEQEYGIKLEEATCHDNIVRDCNVYSHTLYGIYLYDDCYLNTITNCEVYGNKIKGISLVTAYRNIITNCEIYDNANQATADGDGIFLSLANQNTISNCVIHHNGDDGIHMNGESLNPAEDNTIVSCTIYDNGYYATEGGHGINFYLAGADSHPNVIDSCTIYNSTDEGIHLIASDYNVIKNCNVFDNGNDGIQILGSNDNTVEYCNCFDNGDDGLHLGYYSILDGYSHDNAIEHNNFYSNAGAGVFCDATLSGVRGSYDNEIHYNNFALNTLYNAYDECWLGGNVNDWDYNYWDDYGGSGDYEIEKYPSFNEDEHPNEGTITRELSGSYDNPDVILVDDSYGSTNWYHKEHIENAVSNVRESGVVMVYPGTYTNEDIVIDEETSLIGLDKDSVHVDGSGSGDVISVSTTQDNVLISSLDIYNGDKGLCIDTEAFGATNVITISDCKIHNNNEDGIYNDYLRVDIINCEIYNNDWNGIYLDDHADNTDITNCDIHDNDDDGIYLNSNADRIDITNCDIHGNDDDGIYLYQSDKTVIAGCSFYDNDYDGIGGGNGITLKQSGSSELNKNSIINCDIYNNNGNQKHGIHLDDSSNYNEVTNCDIYSNTQYGIHIDSSDDSIVEDCNIYSNTQYGIHIDSSDDSIVEDCNIYSNTQHGIYISNSANYNDITNCDIYSNDDGINIMGSSTQNDIENCNIYSNTQHGIYISNSNNNYIKSRNKIRDNDYGIYLHTSSNNEIHHNNFENNNYNAYETGSNTWHTAYGDPFNPLTDGGNHWSNYDEAAYEGAYDLYSGPSQDILGSDGIVDTAYYPIPGGNSEDGYPFGGGDPEVGRPYYIDYWNPYGQSIILVNMSLKSHTFKYIYLYYGYDTPSAARHTHSISEISVFSDDFNTDLSKWDGDGDPAPLITNGCVYLEDDACIVTSPYWSMEAPEDPPQILYSKSVNDSMYIVEARMKINEGQGNMYFLADGTSSGRYDQSYMVSANVTPVDDFTLLKMDSNIPPSSPLTNMDNDPSVPDLNHWLRMKSYIYMSKTCYKPDSSTTSFENTTVIDAHLYNYDTFAGEGNVSGWDTDIDSDPDDPPGVPWAFRNQNFIGLGAGLPLPAATSKILVDWIRVMKTPIVPPTVSIGSMESSTNNYGWTGTPPDSGNRKTFDPFNPGPVLCDFNNGATPATFVVNLPKDTYTITVTMGDVDASHGPMNIIRVPSAPPTTLLTIPETEPGEFETKWFTINWNGGNLNLRFSGTNWAVNSMLIERDYKGIKIE